MPSQAHQNIANLLRGSFEVGSKNDGEIDIAVLREGLEAMTAAIELPAGTRCEPVDGVVPGGHAKAMQGPFHEDFGTSPDHQAHAGNIDRREPFAGEGADEGLTYIRGGIGQRAIEIEYNRTVLGSNHATSLVSRRASSIMRFSIGIRISSIASSILPPGTTIVLRRDMNELLSIANR